MQLKLRLFEIQVNHSPNIGRAQLKIRSNHSRKNGQVLSKHRISSVWKIVKILTETDVHIAFCIELKNVQLKKWWKRPFVFKVHITTKINVYLKILNKLTDKVFFWLIYLKLFIRKTFNCQRVENQKRSN